MGGDVARRLLQLDAISGDSQRQSVTDELRLKSVESFGSNPSKSKGSTPARGCSTAKAELPPGGTPVTVAFAARRFTE